VGLHKEMDTQFGIPIEYWHIGGLYLDKRVANLHVILYGYGSHKGRLVGATPLVTREYDICTDRSRSPSLDISKEATDGILRAVYVILTTAMVESAGLEEQKPEPFSEFYGVPEE
jgi:hypothetical protein